MSQLEEVVIDARMIQSSGIGVLLRELLQVWSKDHPDFRLKILGDPVLLARILPPQLDAEYIRFSCSVYGFEQLSKKLPIKNVPLYFSPHYSVPISVLKNPSVVMIQDLIHITHPPKFYTPLFMRGALQFLRRKADYIVTPSRHTKVQLQTLYGFRPERVLTFPLGSGICEKPSQFTPKPVQKSEEYFLTVGIDKPHKGFDYLLDCYSKAAKSSSKIPELRIAGLLEHGRRRIARRIHDLGMQAKIHIMDYLPDEKFQILMNDAKALIFPSKVEGFGLPLVEAMKSGVPVVCANLPPMNEITEGAATFFDFDEPQSLVKIFRQPPDASTLTQKIEQGRRNAERYQWTTFANQIEELFHRVHDEGKRS